jgi:hypothetical protein
VWIFDQVQKARKEAAVRLEAADVNDCGILELVLGW